ncbi:MarR family winged helix-turn-helix transcriptional regulator [Antrihabitans cavernicola]|uniref:Winged helix-turn-helix transcriptional regulator n=1 Tax=Antrihabitans cavernicola TaxID=2495913 RepID=A0A5A7SJP3_9NOCA|nr:MarR family winged helix-turn-helix transcriptional regulator [Spelaeibacter cavernicola]KAA0024411.1 winged helix-turn-helix transcriptional regulator [Spelaeibacter cavernicola]
METDASTRLRNKPSWLINKASARAHQLVAEAMGAANAHAYHFAILATVEEFGPSSQVQIGQRCGIDQSDTHSMVIELAAQGHVDRAPDPADRRRNLITLTAAGRHRLDELDAALSDVQDNLCKALSTADRNILTALLTRILS